MRHGAARHVLVAATDGHQSVETLRPHHGLDRIGDHLARDQRIAHARRAHRNAVRDGDGIEQHALAAGGIGAGCRLARQLGDVHVAGGEIGPGRGDADLRLGEILIGEADRAQHGARGRLLDAVHDQARVAARVWRSARRRSLARRAPAISGFGLLVCHWSRYPLSIHTLQPRPQMCQAISRSGGGSADRAPARTGPRRPSGRPGRSLGFQAYRSRCSQLRRAAHKALEKQRRDDRPGKRPSARHCSGRRCGCRAHRRSRPQRQRPDRIGVRAAKLGQLATSASSVLNSAGRSGPSAVRAAPVRVARSISRSGRSASASRQRIGQHQAPFRIGVADLDRQSLARAPHVAGPIGAAADAVLDRRNQHPQLDRGLAAASNSCASASAQAAPPMSFFISSIAAEGLRSSPPLSKHTPLPTSVTRGAPARAPAAIDQARCARAAGADRRDQRILARQRLAAAPPASRRRERPRELARGGGQFLGAELIGRSIDQIARQRHRLRRRLGIAHVGARRGRSARWRPAAALARCRGNG